MKPRRLARKVAVRIPGVNSYLAQKSALSQQVEDLQLTIEKYDKTNKQLEKQIKELTGAPEKHKITWPVAENDIIGAKLSKPLPKPKSQAVKPPFKLTWVIPPMGEISGGHTDIFRVIQHLEKKGHKNTVHFYDPSKNHSLNELKATMAKHYPRVDAEVEYNGRLKDCDGIFATNWFSAYPVANFKNAKQKFYFVQDFEPYFDPVGSYYVLAENTYKFGFYGITLGEWLKEKLTSEYRMDCDSINFGVDNNDYRLTNPKKRKKIVFYARPITPRRAFELGVLSLELFHKAHPEYEVNFVGWDTSNYDLPFPYVNHGVLDNKSLNSLYNECAAGLVLSLTNMSLLPVELLAAGSAVVVNDAPHTRKVKYSSLIDYADPTPQGLAEALYSSAVVAEPKKIAGEVNKLAQELAWERSLEKFEELVSKRLAG